MTRRRSSRVYLDTRKREGVDAIADNPAQTEEWVEQDGNDRAGRSPALGPRPIGPPDDPPLNPRRTP